MSDSDEIIQISDRRRRQSQHINNILMIPDNHIPDNDIRGIIRPRQIYFQDSDDDDYIDPDNILTNRYLQTSGVLTNTIELSSSDPRTYSKCCICDTQKCDTITNCGHAYCQSCIFKWIVKNVSNATCPVCRTPITASSCSRIVIIL
jgi:hypothetical protein